MKYFVSWSPEVFLVILSLSLCEAASLWIALLICSSVSWQTDACRWNNGNSWEITNSTKHTDTSLGIWDPMKSFTLYFYIINREKSIQYSEDQVNPGQKYTLRWLESFFVANLWLIVFSLWNAQFCVDQTSVWLGILRKCSVSKNTPLHLPYFVECMFVLEQEREIGLGH